jgi:hypothetical protein
MPEVMGATSSVEQKPVDRLTNTARLSWPWVILVQPSVIWTGLAASSGLLWLPALLWQLAALAISRVLSAHAMVELDYAAQQSAASAVWSWPRFLFSLVALGLLCIAANTAFAAAILLSANINGSKLTWRQAFTTATYSLIPFALGDALARAAFAMIQPLSHEISGVWAAHLKPFSLGAITFAPDLFPPLSLSWLFCAYFDFFGLWSLLLLWLGLRHFVGLKLARSAWTMLALVLLLALAIAAAWQALQFGLLRASQ